MRQYILNQDLKTLFQGASFAVVAGLLMGAVAHPNLQWDEVRGPQMLMPGGGERGYQTVANTGVGAYLGRQVPEYVIGTDWTQPKAEPAWWTPRGEPAEDEAAPQGDVMAYAAQDVQAYAREAVYREAEPQREAPYYPSARGGRYNESDLPAAPPPPDEDTALDIEPS